MVFKDKVAEEVFLRLLKTDNDNIVRVLDYGAGDAWTSVALEKIFKGTRYKLDYVAVDTSLSVVAKLWERGIVTKTYEDLLLEEDYSYDIILLGDMDGLVSLEELGTLLRLVKNKEGMVMWETRFDFTSMTNFPKFL